MALRLSISVCVVIMHTCSSTAWSVDALDFAVYAKDDVSMESYSTVRGDIYSGNDLTLKFGYGIQQSSNLGDMYAYDDVTIELSGDVAGNVYANDEVRLEGSAEVAGTINSSTGTVPVGTFPAAHEFSVGTQRVTFDDDYTLAPGSYGDVTYTGLYDNLYLSSGDYFLHSLRTESSLDLHLDLTNGPINVFIEEDFVTNAYLSVFVNGIEVDDELPEAIRELARDVLFEVHDDVELITGGIGAFFGTVFAPNGDITIGTRHMYGSLIAGGRIEAESYLLHYPSNELLRGLACDFDSDELCDMDDMDLLYDNFGGSASFDVDGSGSVDGDDIGAWLMSASDPSNLYLDGAKTFEIGDVDLNGEVDSVDLGLLLNNFGDAAGLPYGSGNLNDDPSVDSLDLGLLLNNFGATSTAAVTAVPEPGAISLLLIAAMGMIGIGRGQRTIAVTESCHGSIRGGVEGICGTD